VHYAKLELIGPFPVTVIFQCVLSTETTMVWDFMLTGMDTASNQIPR